MSVLTDEFLAMIQTHADTDAHPPATTSDISAAEVALGFNLPPEYAEFLLRFNGGVFSYARIFGVNRNDYFDIKERGDSMAEFILGSETRQLYPFASDWGGSYFCFNLADRSSSGQCPIVFWNHEYSEEPDDAEYLWSDVSHDFGGFLQKLYEA